MKYKTIYESFLGEILLESDGKKITVIALEGQTYFKDKDNDEIIEKDDLEIFQKAKNWLDRYFRKEKVDSKEIPLTFHGTPFQNLVWQELLEIPYGKVVTYKDIALKVAKKMQRKTMSSQAVGGAIGKNPIAILIPCHRVVGTNHSLTGYNGGVLKKQKLLALESVDIASYSIPK